MEYDTLIKLQRRDKVIVIFLKGDSLSLDAIIDVEVFKDKVLDKPTVIDLEARWGDKGQDVEDNK